LVTAVADPTDLKALDDIGFILGVRIKPLLALESDILNAIEVYYEGKARPEKFVLNIEKMAGNLEAMTPPEAGTPSISARPEGVRGDKTPSDAAVKLKAEISQKTVIDGLIELLIAKGVFTREELIRQIRSKIQT